MTSEIKGGGNNELSTDINTITAEINAYQRVAGEAIFEIGRRLKHVKENDLAHGEFMCWYESIGLTKDFVSKAIRITDSLEDFETSRNIGLEALYQIATLPPEHREAEHITAKGETKTPDEMTVRELRELKRKLKETEQREEAERQERERLEGENEELKDRQNVKVSRIDEKERLAEEKEQAEKDAQAIGKEKKAQPFRLRFVYTSPDIRSIFVY